MSDQKEKLTWDLSYPNEVAFKKYFEKWEIGWLIPAVLLGAVVLFLAIWGILDGGYYILLLIPPTFGALAVAFFFMAIPIKKASLKSCKRLKEQGLLAQAVRELQRKNSREITAATSMREFGWLFTESFLCHTGIFSKDFIAYKDVRSISYRTGYGAEGSDDYLTVYTDHISFDSNAVCSSEAVQGLILLASRCPNAQLTKDAQKLIAQWREKHPC